MYDGCALLHRIAWPKVGTISAVCDSFNSSVSDGHIEVVWVIFDTYDTVSTKDPEQKRRRLKLQQCADIDVTHSTPVPSDKRSFLSNKKNKQKLINLLSQHLANKAISVEQAGDEGDADVIYVICKKAIQMGETHQRVCNG